MKDWTKRDWASVAIGWICGLAAFFLLPSNDYKALEVFLFGFASGWITRRIILL